MNTQFYRSRTDRMIGGICGGIARYLNLDSTLVRLFFVLLAMADGIGVLAYIILWLVMPDEEQAFDGNVRDNVRTSAGEIAEHAQDMAQDVRRAVTTPHPKTHLIVGSALIILGCFWLIDTLNITWLRWLSFDVLWGVLLIIGGAMMLIRRTKEE